LLECLGGRLIIKRLVASVAIIVGGVGSQPALDAGLTAVSGFVEGFNSYRIDVKDLFDDITVSIVEFTTQIGPSKGGEIV
jgi:hypothetical protein